MADNSTHVHLISHCYPADGTGTAIVLRRHLSYLSRAGWQVTVSAPFSAPLDRSVTCDNWRVVKMPTRHWWWPPFRDGYSSLEKLRSRLLAKYLAKSTESSPPNYVIGHAHGFYPSIALEYARIVGARFILIIHDRDDVWTKSPKAASYADGRVRQLVLQADKVVAVTQELLDWYDTPKERAVVLPPIPGCGVYRPEWSRTRLNDFLIVHAGSINGPQESVLSAFAHYLKGFDGQLVLIAPDHDNISRRLAARHSNVQRMPLFALNEDAVRYVADRALAYLAAYSFDRQLQPWLETSFPSKVLDFMRSGVPGIILAPPSAAVTKWANHNGWPTICQHLTKSCIENILQSLSCRSQWEQSSQAVLALAAGAFSAATIQQEFLRVFEVD